jgi:hypothetical protein
MLRTQILLFINKAIHFRLNIMRIS